ncbi:hypothetical protein [uncultured Cohaesibacter sp.]|uniref:hypothetical protein n=1 Tax=uncultured Cohaesibacter sp. TaxID=1002546 RepID=UPI00292CDC9E|nr:hypothetical protein [uncultured Cohaesibacter sp.]
MDRVKGLSRSGLSDRQGWEPVDQVRLMSTLVFFGFASSLTLIILTINHINSCVLDI